MKLLRLSDGAQVVADFRVEEGSPVVVVVEGVVVRPEDIGGYALVEGTPVELVALELSGYLLRRAVLGLKVLPGLTGLVEKEPSGGNVEDDDASFEAGFYDTTLELSLEADSTVDSGVATLTVRNTPRKEEADEPALNQLVFFDSVEQLRQLARMVQEAIEELERAGLR